MPEILIVCTGNLCRSPMAEALLGARLSCDEARREWHVSSAGAWTTNGRPASAYAIEEMAQRGISMSAHRSSSVTRERMETSDLVLAMTRHHAEALEAAFPENAYKVHMLSNMVGQTYSIRDPYGGTRMEYATVAKELEEVIEAGYERIVAVAEGNASG